MVKGCLKLFHKRLFSYFSSFKTYCFSLSRPMRYSFKGQKNLFRTFGLNQLASIHSWWMVNKISRVKRSQNIKKAAMNTILLLLWQRDFLVKMWCSFKIVVWYCYICWYLIETQMCARVWSYLSEKWSSRQTWTSKEQRLLRAAKCAVVDAHLYEGKVSWNRRKVFRTKMWKSSGKSSSLKKVDAMSFEDEVS